jgi:hypothetical protein
LTYALNFNKDDIKSSQIDFVRMNIKPSQLKLITEISRYVCKQIPIPELVIKSAIMDVLKIWQKKNNISISEIATMTLPKQIIFLKEIFTIAKEHLKCMLLQPKENGEIILDIAFERAFKFYLEYFNHSHR